MVNWAHQDRALRSGPLTRAHFRSKHSSGFSGVAKKMLTMGFWPDTKCCRCEALVEDSKHVLRCPQADASATWEHSLAVFKRHLVLANTDPQITKTILSALQAWRTDSDSPSSHPNHLIAASLRDQAALGWHSFLEGLPCNAWTDAQTAYTLTNRQHSRFSPGAWASQLVRWVMGIPLGPLDPAQ
jgi:hypothetical protein